MTGKRMLMNGLIVACVLFTGAHAQAGLIGWTNITYLTNGSEDGTNVILGATDGWYYVDAWNMGDDTDVTVNGVEFLQSPTSMSRSGSFSDVLPTQNGGEFTGSFQTLMQSLTANGGESTDWTITMSGLTLGQTYRAQFVNYQVAGAAGARDMEIHFGNSGAGPGTGAFSAGVSATGNSWVAVFTADAATQDFFVRAGGNDRSIVNAVSLFTVPAPAALPAGLAMLGLIAMRRRKS